MSTRWDLADDIAPEELEAYKAAATSPAAAETFRRLTQELPLEEMAGLGAHSLEPLEAVVRRIKPRRILEVGFGAGASATMFLALTSTVSGTVLSIDWTENWRVMLAALRMERRYHPRFTFCHGESRIVLPKMTATFDLAFIDGAHDLDTVTSDLDGVIRLGVPWVLMDDWWPLLGPGVRPAVEARPELRLAEQWGNLVLLSCREAAETPRVPQDEPVEGSLSSRSPRPPKRPPAPRPARREA